MTPPATPVYVANNPNVMRLRLHRQLFSAPSILSSTASRYVLYALFKNQASTIYANQA